MRRQRAALAAIPVMALAVSAWTWPKIGDTRPLMAGAYRLTLEATEGSRAGGVIVGALTLVKATAEDVSPQTGQRVTEKPSRHPDFYGWVQTDLAGVGAPTCAESPHPAPDSRDPVSPGVVAIKAPYGSGGPFKGMQQVQTVLVGTLSNLRADSGWTDGCGFAMFVLGWDGQCHTGRWAEWGIRKDGRGTFRLCK